MEAWPLFGVLSSAPWWVVLVSAAALLGMLGYVGGRVWLWTIVVVLYGFGADAWLLATGAALALLSIPMLRRQMLTRPAMGLVRALGMLPTISPTERIAIEAGSVWVEGELFSGRPNFRRILREPYPTLTEEEQAFLDGPVEALCASATDWEVYVQRGLPEGTWDLIRRERLFGLIVPKKYGGHAFSATANSAVVAKLSAHCYPMGISVMVPNSLGPAELLIHYGTEEQQEYYLPRLADGSLVPAFALTEPEAGSDAGGIQASGEVFKDSAGEVKVRLNWDKRYITLAAVADLLGLAIKLRDPENILGKGTDPGITCALVRTNLPGITLGKVHDPLGVPFVNSPTQGTDVIAPIDAVIGGADGAGRGWQMLMECLAAGRGISLPATAVGTTKAVFLAASAHVVVRRQFGLPLGKFEGVQEALARIGGFTYLMDAARVYTVGAIDQGAKPAVVTAIVKYNLTELSRKSILDGMDVLAGNGISLGPRNSVAHIFMGMQIAITVEGANILTRTLMIFGQGALRCHPWAVKEVGAIERRDLQGFDRAFWGHVGHVMRNGSRMVLLGLTRGRLASAAGVRGPAARYVRKVQWAASTFAFLSDLAMIGLGGQLKRREMITGRFADVFSWLYLATATIRRFEAEGRRSEDEVFFRWSMDYAFGRIQEALEGLYANLSVPGVTWLFRGPFAAQARLNRMGSGPSDRLSRAVAQRMQVPGAQRTRLTQGCHIPPADRPGMGQLQAAMGLAHQADTIMRKVHQAVRTKALSKRPKATLVDRAYEAGVLSKEERTSIRRSDEARRDAIQVDAFDTEVYRRHYQEAAP